MFGHYNKTELAYLAAEAIGVDLDSTTVELFIELTDQYDWESEYPSRDDPVIVIQRANGKETRINARSDIIEINGSTYTHLKGVVVYAPITRQFWIPKDGWNHHLETYSFN